MKHFIQNYISVFTNSKLFMQALFKSATVKITYNLEFDQHVWNVIVQWMKTLQNGSLFHNEYREISMNVSNHQVPTTLCGLDCIRPAIALRTTLNFLQSQ